MLKSRVGRTPPSPDESDYDSDEFRRELKSTTNGIADCTLWESDESSTCSVDVASVPPRIRSPKAHSKPRSKSRSKHKQSQKVRKKQRRKTETMKPIKSTQSTKSSKPTQSTTTILSTTNRYKKLCANTRYRAPLNDTRNGSNRSNRLTQSTRSNDPNRSSSKHSKSKLSNKKRFGSDSDDDSELEPILNPQTHRKHSRNRNQSQSNRSRPRPLRKLNAPKHVHRPPVSQRNDISRIPKRVHHQKRGKSVGRIKRPSVPKKRTSGQLVDDHPMGPPLKKRKMAPTPPPKPPKPPKPIKSTKITKRSIASNPISGTPRNLKNVPISRKRTSKTRHLLPAPPVLPELPDLFNDPPSTTLTTKKTNGLSPKQRVHPIIPSNVPSQPITIRVPVPIPRVVLVHSKPTTNTTVYVHNEDIS